MMSHTGHLTFASAHGRLQRVQPGRFRCGYRIAGAAVRSCGYTVSIESGPWGLNPRGLGCQGRVCGPAVSLAPWPCAYCYSVVPECLRGLANGVSGQPGHARRESRGLGCVLGGLPRKSGPTRGPDRARATGKASTGRLFP